jgi:hypothetical protein
MSYADFGKKKELGIIENKTTEDAVKDFQKEEEKEDQYEWVEGYKGTDRNMQCNEYQYEFGKVFEHEGEVSLCSSGFHFCRNLNDCYSYYPLLENRFIKVKALVNISEEKRIIEKELEDRKKGWLYYCEKDSKRVTSEIEFISELSYEDFIPYIKSNFCLVENKKEYDELIKGNYELVCRNKFLDFMKSNGFSDVFAIVMFNKNGSDNSLKSIMECVQILIEEKVSRDMLIYLLFTQFFKSE